MSLRKKGNEGVQTPYLRRLRSSRLSPRAQSVLGSVPQSVPENRGVQGSIPQGVHGAGRASGSGVSTNIVRNTFKSWTLRPDVPFLAPLEFLAFFFSKEFLAFFSVFPFFPRDFRGRQRIKKSLLFWWFSLPFPKSKERKIRVGTTFWTLWSPQPEGPQKHPVGYSPKNLFGLFF